MSVIVPEKLEPIHHCCYSTPAKAKGKSNPLLVSQKSSERFFKHLLNSFYLFKQIGSMTRNNKSIEEIEQPPEIRIKLESSVGKRLRKC